MADLSSKYMSKANRQTTLNRHNRFQRTIKPQKGLSSGTSYHGYYAAVLNCDTADPDDDRPKGHLHADPEDELLGPRERDADVVDVADGDDDVDVADVVDVTDFDDVGAQAGSDEDIANGDQSDEYGSNLDHLEYHEDNSIQAEECQYVYSQCKGESRLCHIRLELLTTEQRYVSRLEDLVTIRDVTLRILGEATAKEMFQNIDVIYNFHLNFLPTLKERIGNWDEDSRLGDLTVKMMSFLKTYTDYVKGIRKAIDLVILWRRKNKAFRQLIKDYTVRSDKLEMDARMVAPVQRVAKYELLLKDYLKCLPEGSEDFEAVKESIDKVSEAARHFEAMIEQDMQAAKLLKLQHSLDSPVNIFSSSRSIIKEGKASIYNKKTEKFEQCNIYLLSDLLMITQDLHMLLSVRKKVKHVINLVKAKVTRDGLDKGLIVFTRFAEVRVRFGTNEEMVTWEQAIRERLVELTKGKLIQRGTWKNPLSQTQPFQTPPQIVPPHTVQVCMLCGKDFDTPKRKKNCEACGMVVCGLCSPHRIRLPYDKNTEHRVCNNCFACHCKSLS